MNVQYSAAWKSSWRHEIGQFENLKKSDWRFSGGSRMEVIEKLQPFDAPRDPDPGDRYAYLAVDLKPKKRMAQSRGAGTMTNMPWRRSRVRLSGKCQMESARACVSGITVAMLQSVLRTALICILSETSYAQVSISFVKIADTNTVIPHDTLLFTGFGPPVIDAGLVAFSGWHKTPTEFVQNGLYVYRDGMIVRVFDKNTPIPDDSNTMFTGGGAPSIDAQEMAFVGSYGTGHGVFVIDNNTGTMSRIVDTSTRIPDTHTFFEYISDPSFENGNVAFSGTDRKYNEGIYYYSASTGQITTVADSNTVVPGFTATFQSLYYPDLHGANVVFRGQATDWQWEGLYVWSEGTLTKLLDRSDVMPGGGVFSTFLRPVGNGGRIAFCGTGDGPGGYFIWENGVLTTVMTVGMPVPDSNDTFGGLGPTGIVSIGGDTAAFMARRLSTSGPLGIYVSVEGRLAKIITSSDTLDGRYISSLGISKQALSGNQVVFNVEFATPGTGGVYMATFQVQDDDQDGVWNDTDICPNTIPGADVDSAGCPPAIQCDLDGDGDVDLVDFLFFEEGASGPAVAVESGFEDRDLDGDNDVDQSDFAVFQRCYSGENIPADPNCAS